MKFDQVEFFDHHPALYPWPQLLRKKGFNRAFKLKDAKLRNLLASLRIGRGKQALDVGCGDGTFIDRLASTFRATGTGVDFSPVTIRSAKSLSSSRLKFLVADAAALPFRPKTFDLVFSFDTLEHIKEWQKVISEMSRVLKPKGKLLVYAVAKNQKYTWNWWLDKLGIDIYENYAHDPALFLEPAKVKNQIEKNGLKVKKLIFFNSFFTLAVDEAIMVLVSLFCRLKLFGTKTGSRLFLGKIFLFLANLISRLLLPILEYLDQPWANRGYANGFFIVAQKRKMTKGQARIWGVAKATLEPSSLSALRLKYCLEDLEKVNGRVLEVGCGAGMFMAAIKKNRPDLKMFGIDIDKRAIVVARKRRRQFSFRVADGGNLPFKNGYFDAVVVFDVLEHLSQPEKTLLEIRRVLAPNGIFHFYIPCDGEPITIQGIFGKLGVRPKIEYAGHIQQFNLKEVRQLLEKTGFKVEKQRYSSHLLNQMVDFGYFYIMSILKREPGSTVEGYLEKKGSSKGFTWRLLSFFKTLFAILSYSESSILKDVPAHGVHYGGVKSGKK